jgi:hypothetical protein
VGKRICGWGAGGGGGETQTWRMEPTGGSQSQQAAISLMDQLEEGSCNVLHGFPEQTWACPTLLRLPYTVKNKIQSNSTKR